MPRIVIRVDASQVIGSGHVMRCLTLADELGRLGAEVTFVCREHLGNLIGMIEDKGYAVVRLQSPPDRYSPSVGDVPHAAWLGVNWEQDANETMVALGRARFEWLVVDHYALDRCWEKALRSHADRIMVIDDLADRPHECDLLLDQNLYRNMESRYSGLLSDGCVTLLGPRYALLRREFLEARRELPQRDGSVKNVLVFFGGTDFSNQTEKALEALKTIAAHVDVVVGPINPNRDRIRSICDGRKNTVFHYNTNEMARIMAEADLCVSSGGSSTWERCVLGVPSIVISVADNQDELTNWGARHGLYIFLGKADSVSVEMLSGTLKLAMSSPAMLAHFTDAGLRLVDGRGGQRVAQLLCPPGITIRRATLDDCEMVYEWRNADETRRYIFNTEAIPIETHWSWYRATLECANRVLLIGEIDGSPVGVLRYDIGGDEALISIYLVPGGQGQGIGSYLIQCGSEWMRKHYPSIRRIVAEVVQENIASIRAFESAGFTEHHRTLHEVL
jgi:UDP-2,4-diacetamido-2,4,6-trideoxy-beta-L-altropyranose hydrolase